MTSDPVILVLEDERAQILTLRSQLAGLGRLAEFSDAKQALEFARGNACDAAIVDVNMPRSSMDGLAFLRALRTFDRELAIIVRTGSESDHIADGAIELRAIKRAVKSKTSLAELRSSTQEAIRETRERRETSRNARDNEATKTSLAEALGSYDLRLAAADLNRGLVQTLRNQLTALSALSAVLREDAASSGRPEFEMHAGRASKLVAGMVDSVNAFLDSPLAERGGVGHAGVNECLETLRQFFRGEERWAAEDKRLTIRSLLGDTRVVCAPIELTNGLRHLVEYFLARAPKGAEVRLAAAIVHAPAALAERLAGAGCVLNRGALRPEHPHVGFRVSAPIEGVSLDIVRDAFSLVPQSGRTGNLNVLSRILVGVRGVALLSAGRTSGLTVEALFPVAI
jgi:CheY-like chemotaxis protein